MNKVIVITLSLICFFILIFCVTNPFSRVPEKKDIDLEFRSVIIKLSKSDRNYDNITLKGDSKPLYIIDRLKRSYLYQLQIGDSLIKEKHSCTFIYKRNEKIIFVANDACKDIFKTQGPF